MKWNGGAVVPELYGFYPQCEMNVLLAGHWLRSFDIVTPRACVGGRKSAILYSPGPWIFPSRFKECVSHILFGRGGLSRQKPRAPEDCSTPPSLS